MIVIELPWPPSVNHYWRTPRSGKLAGRTMISVEGRLYRTLVAQAVLTQRAGLRLQRRLAVDIEAIPPDRRARDIDNIPKAILDGLTHAGVWEDDSLIDDLRIWRRPGAIGGVVKVRVTEATCSEV